jgi:hypothetical protein
MFNIAQKIGYRGCYMSWGDRRGGRGGGELEYLALEPFGDALSIQSTTRPNS